MAVVSATALIRPLAWELPYATGAALKRQKKEKMMTELGKQCELGVKESQPTILKAKCKAAAKL